MRPFSLAQLSIAHQLTFIATSYNREANKSWTGSTSSETTGVPLPTGAPLVAATLAEDPQLIYKTFVGLDASCSQYGFAP